MITKLMPKWSVSDCDNDITTSFVNTARYHLCMTAWYVAKYV